MSTYQPATITTKLSIIKQWLATIPYIASSSMIFTAQVWSFLKNQSFVKSSYSKSVAVTVSVVVVAMRILHCFIC